LIVGPLFNDENRVIQDFSLENKINVFNPFSNNSEVTGINPYAFLFQPSSETMGKKSAEFLADHIANKNCMVIYGAAKKDSVLMANFSQKALEKGLKIVSAMKVSAREAGKITQILATPTEYDEFKYPSQFTLRKDSIDGILVASDDALIYSKVVSSVETRADSIMVIGSENWLDDTAIDLEKYQSLGIVLAAPNFVSVSDKHYQTFQKKFIRIHGRTPSNMARMGYEFMMFAGHQLKTNGVYFQEGLNNAGQSPGFIGQGYNYQFSHDNQLVPFIKFEKGEPIVVQKR
ncbi:MAG: ABC transporter substrate-binding protein, partial [Bacteroidota bacterium]